MPVGRLYDEARGCRGWQIIYMQGTGGQWVCRFGPGAMAVGRFDIALWKASILARDAACQ